MWKDLIEITYQLQVAFSNKRTFYWFILVIIGFCVRIDCFGDTSFIRSIGLLPEAYSGLNHFFHSSSIRLNLLTTRWIEIAFKIFGEHYFKVNNRFVVIGDGIKVSKEGKKMPGVKSSHQESQNNSKPEFIMAHSIQVLSLLVGRLGSYFAVPLIVRIHEGVYYSNFKQKTLIDKMWDLFSFCKKYSCYIVLDAYYRNSKLISKIVSSGSHLVVRLKGNAVAYTVPRKKKIKGRGRPKIHGIKIKLNDVFKDVKFFKTAMSPVYKEKHVKIKYYSRILRIRGYEKGVKIVWCIHPTRGKMILLCTDLNISPIEIVKLYGYRFKIEVSFKVMIQTIGTFAYHFWMKTMTPIKRKSKGQYLHKKSKNYRNKVKQKINAYHLHIQVGFIAQGLMQFLSIVKTETVWSCFKGYVRTIRKNVLPSEWITGYALRERLFEFIRNIDFDRNLSKFIESKLDYRKLLFNRSFNSPGYEKAS